MGKKDKLSAEQKANRAKYVPFAQFYRLTVSRETTTQVLQLWNDEHNLYRGTQDVFPGEKPNVAPTETITFYPDRWEQVNAKGTFKGVYTN